MGDLLKVVQKGSFSDIYSKIKQSKSQWCDAEASRALEIACLRGYTRIASLLISKANALVTDYAIMCAIKKRRYKCVELLLLSTETCGKLKIGQLKIARI